MTGFLLVGENGSAPLRVVEDSLLDAARFVARPVPACGGARWDDYVFELAGSLEVAQVLVRAVRARSARPRIPFPWPQATHRRYRG